jgi:hypothetical protein
MKKKILFIMVTGVMLLFVACKGNNQETNFIQPPKDFTEDDDIVIPDDPIDDFEEPTDNSDDEEDEPVYVGETTTKYVKLRSYGAILNVRSEPNTESDNVVGFLVHTEPIEVISIDGDWAKFLYKDEIRYVSAEFLVDTVPPYVSPPTQTLPAN